MRLNPGEQIGANQIQLWIDVNDPQCVLAAIRHNANQTAEARDIVYYDNLSTTDHAVRLEEQVSSYLLTIEPQALDRSDAAILIALWTPNGLTKAAPMALTIEPGGKCADLGTLGVRGNTLIIGAIHNNGAGIKFTYRPSLFAGEMPDLFHKFGVDIA